MSYHQEGNVDKYRLTLARPMGVDFRLPVRAEKVRRGRPQNGDEVAWSIEAGFGCTWVRLRTQKLESAEVAIEVSKRTPRGVAVNLEGKVGDEIRLNGLKAIVHWHKLHQCDRGGKAL